jgi:hypothetical protein
MGIVKMPSVSGYWETGTRYPPVADVMSRNRFQKIVSTIHLQDNLEVTEEQRKDKAWKIRPWFDYLNLNFGTVSPSEINVWMKQWLPSKEDHILSSIFLRSPRNGDSNFGLDVLPPDLCTSLTYTKAKELAEMILMFLIADLAEMWSLSCVHPSHLTETSRILQTTTFLILPW